MKTRQISSRSSDYGDSWVSIQLGADGQVRLCQYYSSGDFAVIELWPEEWELAADFVDWMGGPPETEDEEGAE